MHADTLPILADYPLKRLNTFGIDARCALFCAPVSERQLLQAAQRGVFGGRFFVLGGGSNVLFARSYYDGCIVHPAIDFIEKISETADAVWLRAGAGTQWDRVAAHCTANGWYGIENLSHIPGSVGAAPVQNIGAYGVEAAACIHEVRWFDIACNAFKTLAGGQCGFGYRTSIFKRELKNRAVITAVTFVLQKNAPLQTHYASLHAELERLGGGITLQSVRQAVINVRTRKLPDPAVVGNAGSFFKNPEVSREEAVRLQGLYPSMPAYSGAGGGVKVSAAWLIEQCGWRGRRLGEAGVHSGQALVLINCGNASGSAILTLARTIAEDVKRRFGIELEREVCEAGGEEERQQRW